MSAGTESQEAPIFNALAKKKPLMKFHTVHAEQILRKMFSYVISCQDRQEQRPRVCLELAPWWLLQLSKSRVESGHGDTGEKTERHSMNGCILHMSSAITGPLIEPAMPPPSKSLIKAGDMAWSVKCLLNQHRGLTVCVNVPSMVANFCSSRIRKADR